MNLLIFFTFFVIFFFLWSLVALRDGKFTDREVDIGFWGAVVLALVVTVVVT